MTMEILTPQDKEIVETLMQTGHIGIALDIKEAKEELENNDPYATRKAEIRYKLIGMIAKRLEATLCAKESMPCHLCVAHAREAGKLFWYIFEQFCSMSSNIHSWVPAIDMFNLFDQIMVTLNQQAITASNTVHSSGVVQEPKLEMKRPSKVSKL